tara:strand:+ start:744 stop:902 length:159 start_codon:yes stop_codon:yes gene_type:complete
MKKIKVQGTWSKTFWANDIKTAIEYGKDLATYYPQANLEITGVVFEGVLEEE